jgi:formylglycine-generating enzyme required for sulfatase activity
LKIVGYTENFFHKAAVVQSDISPKQAEYFAEKLGVGVILEMVSIPEGTFMMGSSDNEGGRPDRENPQHQVTVAPCFLGKYPITQEQSEDCRAAYRLNKSRDRIAETIGFRVVCSSERT